MGRSSKPGPAMALTMRASSCQTFNPAQGELELRLGPPQLLLALALTLGRLPLRSPPLWLAPPSTTRPTTPPPQPPPLCTQPYSLYPVRLSCKPLPLPADQRPAPWSARLIPCSQRHLPIPL